MSIIIVLTTQFSIKTFAAELPAHDSLRILIVSDEVNPHNLPDNELTQPGDISIALSSPLNGLNIDTVAEIPTNNIDQATALLNLPVSDPNHFDVLIYYSHRIPNDEGAIQNQLDQDNFTDAVEAFLQIGGKVIGFHHGVYYWSGKEDILDILGSTANGAVPYDTISGQNVINVNQGHFITTNGIEYSSTITYEDTELGIPNNSYSYFNNTPDELYPTHYINVSAGDIEPLFSSNYNSSSHILGYIHTRPEWEGMVIVYQPGEYQPNALDDFDGNNFQILANMIVYEFPLDCYDTPNGEAFIDSCGTCAGGETGIDPKLDINECITGVEDELFSASIYPNPVNNMLYVESHLKQTAYIYDSFSRTRIKFELQNKTNQLDISELSNGLYFLIIGDRSMKFVVEH